MKSIEYKEVAVECFDLYHGPYVSDISMEIQVYSVMSDLKFNIIDIENEAS